MVLFTALLAYVATVVGRIRIAQWRVWRVWRVLFLVFPTIFLRIAFVFDWFTVIGIIWQIKFVRWQVWQWWVWLRVHWYMRFLFLLWWICWLCWRICRSCQWHRVWQFPPDRNQVNWWHCFVVRGSTKMSRFQTWSTHINILPPKILIFLPSFKISFGAIVFF